MPMNGMPPMPPGGQEFGTSPEAGPVGQGQPPGGPPMPPGGPQGPPAGPPGAEGPGDEGRIELLELLMQIPEFKELFLRKQQEGALQGVPTPPQGPGGPGGMPPEAGGPQGNSFSQKLQELQG